MEIAPGASGTVWRHRPLPERARVAGYAALIDALDLHVPLPRRLAGTVERHSKVQSESWTLLTPRHAPEPTLFGHLTFALKNEGVELTVLKKVFEAVGPAPIEALVRAVPTSAYARRIWFFYEWLREAQLDLPDARGGRFVDAVDTRLQMGTEGTATKRYRVRNNLPGTPAFCPMVWRTEALDRFRAVDLRARARETVARIPRDLLSRTAAFLLLKDSRASYAIEGERPAHTRIHRWGRAIGQAGRLPLTLEELLRLQAIVIGDSRFVELGLRRDFGFVGERDRESRAAIPAHIDARPEDVLALLGGLLEVARTSYTVDPIVAAAVVAFGFVYIHPFVDGNGRIHRYLIHHVLAERGFHPPGVHFPISAVILERIAEYAAVLESYSAPLLDVICWRPRADGNVEVVGETADFYRYFDATPHAEFLYRCVEQTIDVELPREAELLRRYDQWRATVEQLVDMPDDTLDLLYRALQNNNGKLSKRVLKKRFEALAEEEIRAIEDAYSNLFGGEASD